MIRTNLATRPFYNERAVHLLLGLAAVLVLALTAYNVVRIISLSRQNTEFTTRINRDRAEARRMTAEAEKIRAGIDQKELQATADAAADANRLIDQRTFSWTAFFNRIEETLPADVMLTAVQPSFDQDVPVVVMTAVARRSEDVEEFINRLEATGAFSNVLPQSTEPTEEGLHRVVLRSVYSNAAAAKPASAGDASPSPEPQPVSQPGGVSGEATAAPDAAKPRQEGGPR
jgi:Tfp pilus assembly protein PilN